MSTFRLVGRLIACWLAGLVVCIPILISFDPSVALVDSVIFVPAGILVSFPFLIVAIVLLVTFRTHIQGHLLAWCTFVPFGIAFGWAVVEYLNIAAMLYGIHFTDPIEVFSSRGIQVRVVLALTCAALSAVLFYFWNRRREERRLTE